MTPWEFVTKWVPRRKHGLNPGDHGFKTQAARELSRALKGTVAPETIRKGWGNDFSKCPPLVPHHLDLVDRMREIHERSQIDHSPSDDETSL